MQYESKTAREITIVAWWQARDKEETKKKTLNDLWPIIRWPFGTAKQQTNVVQIRVHTGITFCISGKSRPLHKSVETNKRAFQYSLHESVTVNVHFMNMFQPVHTELFMDAIARKFSGKRKKKFEPKMWTKKKKEKKINKQRNGAFVTHKNRDHAQSQCCVLFLCSKTISCSRDTF